MNLIGTTSLLLLLQLFTKIKSLTETEQQQPPKPNGIISSSMRRRLLLSAGSTPVLIYKGAQPWAPLAQAKAFAVKTQPLVFKGEKGELNELKSGVQPAQALEDFEGSGEEPELSHSSDYNNNEVPERDGNSDLHESLRQPLKRLSNRQLSVLLKQIRGQRRKQQETEGGNDETAQEGQSRKSMLTELHSLLRSSSNSQRLRRPKLLTNINIIPNEWNIYPPKRLNNNEENNKNETNLEGDINGGDINLLNDTSVDNNKRSENTTDEKPKDEQEQQPNEATSTAGTSTEVTTTESSTTESSKTTESTTTESSTTEVKRTEGPIPEEGLNEKDMSDNAEFKRTTEPIKTTTKTTTIESSSTVESLHSVEIAPIDKDDKLAEKAKGHEDEKHHSKQQKSTNKEKQKTTFESKKSKDEQRISRLKAHWRVVEQKIANEMNAAIKNSSKVISEAKKLLIKGGNKKNNSLIFASKTFDPTLDSEISEDENKTKQLADFKTAQFAALSTQLRQIRQRYEALKRQYLAKLKWLKSKKEGRGKGGNKKDRNKIAGAPTFLDGAELDLDSAGIRRNKTNSQINKGENKQNDPNSQTRLDEHENNEKNKTKENHGIIQTELEELKHEEELAKKIIESKIEEVKEDEKKIEETLSTVIGEEQTTINDKENDGITDTTPVTSSTNTLPLKKKKKKKNQEKQQKKDKPKQSLKLTLAELAEELNKLDEKLFGDVGEQLNSTIKEETEKDKKEKEEILEGNKSIKNPTKEGIKAQIKPHKNKNLVKKKKHKTQKQQLKKSSRVNSSPDLLPSQVPIKPVNQVKQNAASAQPKPLPPTGRRILTADWTPRTLLSDDHEEEDRGTSNQVNGQTLPIKVEEGTRGISHQLDLPPSIEPSSNQQHQPLLDPTRKSVKKPGKHNNTITTQQHRLPIAQQQQNVPQKQNGFYQLDKAQVTNVTPKKPPITPDNADFKLKGVSQVQVRASPEHMEENEQNNENEELSEQQLQLKLQQENSQKKKQKHLIKENKKKNKKKNKNKKGERILEEEFDELANLEEFARIDEQTICDAIACDFETGTLCEWEASLDELHPSDPRYKRYLMARRQHIMDRMMRKMAKRSRRSAEQNEGEEVKEEDKGEEIAEKVPKKKKNNKNKGDKKKGKKKSKKESLKRILKEENNQTSILRTWHNWVGQYKNRLTGIAKSEFFSTRNQRFAASYLKPGQRSTLTGRVLSGEQANIRFWVWEATRDLQLRVCCDDTGNEEQCVFQTDKGVKRGSRRWIEQTATCPQGTKKIIFECRNLGRFQGACGLDNIQLLNNYCPSITSTRITRK